METKLETSISSLWSSSLVTNLSFKYLSSGAKLEQFIHVELKFLKLEFYRTICRWRWRRTKEPDRKPESKEEFGEAKQRSGEAEEEFGKADPKKQNDLKNRWSDLEWRSAEADEKEQGKKKKTKMNSLIWKKMVELKS